MSAAVTAASDRAGHADEAAETARHYADRFAGFEKLLPETLGTTAAAVVDQVARRPDGTLDLERLARLTVAAALRIDSHESDHMENPWWETR